MSNDNNWRFVADEEDGGVLCLFWGDHPVMGSNKCEYYEPSEAEKEKILLALNGTELIGRYVKLCADNDWRGGGGEVSDAVENDV